MGNQNSETFKIFLIFKTVLDKKNLFLQRCVRVIKTLAHRNRFTGILKTSYVRAFFQTSSRRLHDAWFARKTS